MHTLRIRTRNGTFLVDTNHRRHVPSDRHITYQKQYRTCGKATCTPCRTGRKHGPYLYAYWREGAKMRSAYIGKIATGLVDRTA